MEQVKWYKRLLSEKPPHHMGIKTLYLFEV